MVLQQVNAVGGGLVKFARPNLTCAIMLEKKYFFVKDFKKRIFSTAYSRSIAWMNILKKKHQMDFEK